MKDKCKNCTIPLCKTENLFVLFVRLELKVLKSFDLILRT